MLSARSAPNSLPVIREAPYHKGGFFAVGQSHNGLLRVPMAVRLILDLIPGKQSQLARVDRGSLDRLTDTGSCVGCNLSGVNLEGLNLDGADLRQADLSNANLSSSRLVRANLWQANLNGAALNSVDLTGTNLRGVNLRGRNLRRAYLPVNWLG